MDVCLQRRDLCGVFVTLLDLTLAYLDTPLYGSLMHKMVYRHAQGVGHWRRRSLTLRIDGVTRRSKYADTSRLDTTSTYVMWSVRYDAIQSFVGNAGGAVWRGTVIRSISAP